MPTGYTARLEEMKYDLKRWLKESAVRGMGLCMSIRDNGDMTEEQIRDAMKKDASDSYHTDKLREAKALLDSLEMRTTAQWRDAWTEDKKAAAVGNEKRLKEFNAKKEAHVAAMNKVDAMLQKAESRDAGEVVIGTLRFAKDQLISAFDFDYGTGPYLNETESMTLDTYIEKTLDKARWDVNYHSKYEAKDKTRTRDTAAEYDKFTRWVDGFNSDNA